MPATRLTLLYGATIFLSAALMFVLEPLFAKLLLPLVGGAPAVWPTSMAFYQLLLLLGYGYAHLLTQCRSRRVQITIQVIVAAAPLALLPIGVSPEATPPTAGTPIYWLLAIMAATIGAPFFALCTMSPLLQRWYSLLGAKDSHDPYFLYAASNAGSMLALLSYPFIIEPLSTLKLQSFSWSIGYGLLTILVAACAIFFSRATTEADATSAKPEAVAAARKWRWVFLAFVPSSLMLGLTTFVTTDVAAVPLLWVLPLAAYLLSFIIVFSRRPLLPHRIVMVVFPWILAAMIVFLAIPIKKPYLVVIAVQFIGFFVTALAAHGELAKDRPAPSGLTGYYFLMALGGVFGGLFNALLAPVLFRSVSEYPVAALLAAFILPSLKWRSLISIWVPAVIVAVFAISLRFLTEGIAFSLAIIVLAVFGASFVQRAWWYVGAMAGALLIGQLFRPEFGTLIDQERGFFGVLRVIDYGSFRFLYHGTTLHGAQDHWPGQEHTPLTYYFPNGPIGQALSAFPKDRLQRVGLVGLGAGSLLAYTQPGQNWTVYEIDPLVVKIASSPRFFTYLSDSKVRPEIVLGDARLQLQKSSETYDLLILDAYSSDAVPVHLLTREALRTYLARLAPHGVIAFHISNSRMDLEPLVYLLLEDAKLSGLAFLDRPISPFDEGRGKDPSFWVLAARDRSDLSFLDGHGAWRPLAPKEGMKLWTDDYSSLWSVLKL